MVSASYPAGLLKPCTSQSSQCGALPQTTKGGSHLAAGHEIPAGSVDRDCFPDGGSTHPGPAPEPALLSLQKSAALSFR